MTQPYTQRFTEVHEPGGTIFPTTRQNGTYNTAWLSMRDHQRIIFILVVADIAALGTVDFHVEQATDADGTDATMFFHNAGVISITQLTQAGGDGNDLVAVEVRTEQMDVNDAYCYLRGVLTIGTNSATVAVVPLRGCSNYPAVPTTGWTEIVVD